MKSVGRTATKFLAAVLVAMMVLISGGASAEAGGPGSGTILQEGHHDRARPTYCGGLVKTSLSDAKRSYQNRCGEAWRYNSGHHRCMWVQTAGGGWWCWHSR